MALPSGGRAVYLLSSHRSCWERYRGFGKLRLAGGLPAVSLRLARSLSCDQSIRAEGICLVDATLTHQPRKILPRIIRHQSVNPRLDTSDDMSDCFDPTQAPLAPPNLPSRPGPKPRPKPKQNHCRNHVCLGGDRVRLGDGLNVQTSQSVVSMKESDAECTREFGLSSTLSLFLDL
jgi:hypothetical protein